MCFELIGWMVFGFIVGGFARFLVPGDDAMGCLGTIALGVAGSMAGGFLGYLVFRRPYEPASFFGALIGAVLVLLIYRRFVVKQDY